MRAVNGQLALAFSDSATTDGMTTRRLLNNRGFPSNLLIFEAHVSVTRELSWAELQASA
jgi:hypothetical protein